MVVGLKRVRLWMRALPLLLLSLTLTAAPCAHCAIQPQEQAEPGHDCCPKQKQDGDESSCTWMPAQYVAPEGVTPGVEFAAAAMMPVPPLADAPAPPAAPAGPMDEAPPPASPPLYLTQASLLI